MLSVLFVWLMRQRPQGRQGVNILNKFVQGSIKTRIPKKSRSTYDLFSCAQDPLNPELKALPETTNPLRTSNPARQFLKTCPSSAVFFWRHCDVMERETSCHLLARGIPTDHVRFASL